MASTKILTCAIAFAIYLFAMHAIFGLMFFLAGYAQNSTIQSYAPFLKWAFPWSIDSYTNEAMEIEKARQSNQYKPFIVAIVYVRLCLCFFEFIIGVSVNE